MKKILIAALTAAMGLCMACGMAACGEEPSGHVHTYSLGWSHNATHHWHALTCEDSATVSPESLAGDKNSGYGEHSFNESGVCSVCKYDPANPEGPAKPEHQHTYVWRYVVGQEPTCTDSGIEEHVCSGCGEYSPEEPKQRTVGMLGHNPSKTYSHDNFRHWNTCTRCSEEIDVTAHDYSSGYVCSTCSFALRATENLLTWKPNGTDPSVILTGLQNMNAGTPADIVIPATLSVSPSISIVEIADYAFAAKQTWDGSENTATSGRNITSVIVMGNSLKKIGAGAFIGCPKLAEFMLPASSITSIGAGAFDGTAFYNDPANWDEDGALYIGNYLIRVKDTATGTFRIKEGTTLIADGAFSGCGQITEIELPETLTVIGSGTFSGCDALCRFIVPQENTNYDLRDGVLYHKVSPSFSSIVHVPMKLVGSITIPSTVTSVDERAFYGRTSITGVTFESRTGSSLTVSIGDYAFSGCTSLSELDFGESVAKIGAFAFQDCRELTEIVIPESVTEIGTLAFSGCTSLAAVHFADPDGWVGSYNEGLPGSGEEMTEPLNRDYLADPAIAAECVKGPSAQYGNYYAYNWKKNKA